MHEQSALVHQKLHTQTHPIASDARTGSRRARDLAVVATEKGAEQSKGLHKGTRLFVRNQIAQEGATECVLQARRQSERQLLLADFLAEIEERPAGILCGDGVIQTAK